MSGSSVRGELLIFCRFEWFVLPSGRISSATRARNATSLAGIETCQGLVVQPAGIVVTQSIPFCDS
jgi:hypothetical protein